VKLLAVSPTQNRQKETNTSLKIIAKGNFLLAIFDRIERFKPRN
jgi:hypothetical protein